MSSSNSRNDEKLQQRFQNILEALLKHPANDLCADCGSKGPRWASVNLGIFVCIRCSGIHRNMGTHISKVKSVSLDKWLPEMIKNMEVIGNANARLIYEARLPDRYNRPRESDNYAVEQWIRDKYDRKKWYDPAVEQRILAGGAPNPSPVSQPRSSSEEEQRRARREERRRKREEEKKRQAPTSSGSGDLLFDPFGATANLSATPIASAPAPQSVDPNMMFSEFQSAGSANSNFIEQNANASFFQQPGHQQAAQIQPPQQVQQAPQPGVSKDSIMSLFRTQAAPPANGMGGFQQGGFNQMGGFGQQPANMGGMYINQGQIPQQQIPNNMGMGMGMGMGAPQGNYNMMYNQVPSGGVPANQQFGAPQNGVPANYGIASQSAGYQSPAANNYAYNHQANRSAW